MSCGRVGAISDHRRSSKASEASNAKQDKHWGPLRGVGEGRKLEAATNPHSLVSLEGAGGEVELNIIKPKGELYR